MAWQLILETTAHTGKIKTRVVYSGSPGTCQDHLRQKQYTLKPGEKLTIVDDSGWPLITKRGPIE